MNVSKKRQREVIIGVNYVNAVIIINRMAARILRAIKISVNNIKA